MLKQQHLVVGLGELLWDLFPSGKQLGGAPANFAYITNLLGDAGIPASRVGHDSLGDEVFQHLVRLGLNSDFVQRDPVHGTGTVKVLVDQGGLASRLGKGLAGTFWSGPRNGSNWRKTWMPSVSDRWDNVRRRAVQPFSTFCEPCAAMRCEYSTSTSGSIFIRWK